MNRVFNDACDKNVAVVKIWFYNNNYYYESTHQAADKVATADLFNLFCKGVICCKADVWYAAKSCTEAGVIDFGFPA